MPRLKPTVKLKDPDCFHNSSFAVLAVAYYLVYEDVYKRQWYALWIPAAAFVFPVHRKPFTIPAFCRRSLM